MRPPPVPDSTFSELKSIFKFFFYNQSCGSGWTVFIGVVALIFKNILFFTNLVLFLFSGKTLTNEQVTIFRKYEKIEANFTASIFNILKILDPDP